MKRSQLSSWTRLILLATLALTSPGGLADGPADPVQAAEGLWEYTGLVTRDGTSMPLTGVFLIKDGIFVQQSLFNGEPFASQGAMAHVGPYWSGGAGMRLTSNQTLSMDPTAAVPLSDAGVMQHDLAVTRDGDELTLIFGGGTSTVQTFRRLGDAAHTQLYAFADGALAFADGYFILVSGTGERAVTGYGKYRLDDGVLTMNAIRWAASDGRAVINLQDATITARFDGESLTLPGGQRFAVID